MKWIPLSERKPDIPYTSNILFAKEGYIIGSYSVLQPKDATHWMYLEPPKPEKPMNEFSVRYPCHAEKPKDPDWEILSGNYTNWLRDKISIDEFITQIYEFLKAKYDRTDNPL